METYALDGSTRPRVCHLKNGNFQFPFLFIKTNTKMAFLNHDSKFS